VEAVVKRRWNVLLCGEPPAVEEILCGLRPHFREPVHCWRADGPEAPPDFSGGTLIVEHLNRCQPLAQQALLEWCSDTSRDVQVVAAINSRLFDLVERGCFLAPLYYRLNTVYVDLMN
jgi:Sigma-54 interaction domain